MNSYQKYKKKVDNYAYQVSIAFGAGIILFILVLGSVAFNFPYGLLMMPICLLCLVYALNTACNSSNFQMSNRHIEKAYNKKVAQYNKDYEEFLNR